jgi:hypothetical protein
MAYAIFLLFMPVFWGWWETALMLAGAAFLLFQLPRLKEARPAQRLALAGCALIAGTTLLSPSLWTRIHVPIASMVSLREGLMQAQLAHTAGQNSLDPEGFRNRLAFLLESVVSSRVMYMESASFDVPPYHELIDAYEASPLSGRTGSFLWDGLILGLALAGGWRAFRIRSAGGLLVLSMLFVTGILIVFMTSLAWQRYYLILQIPYALLAGLGLNQLSAWMRMGSNKPAVP